MTQTINKFFKGFLYAFKGIMLGLKERNLKFHAFATLVVILFSLFLEINKTEWIIILILIGLVWSSELINTSLEDLANVVKKSLNLDYSATTKTRDLAAGAVLVIAIISAIIGLSIFLPKL